MSDSMGETMGNPLRRLYNWVVGWSFSPYGTWALFFIAFAESSFFPIPPDVLLIALAVGNPQRSLWFATVSLSGSILGGLLGYAIGVAVWTTVSHLFFAYVPGFTPELFEKVAVLYRENAFLAVFAAGFSPIPYKVFTICAGVASINIATFVAASILSRGLRFFLVAGLIRLFGKRIDIFIQKYFNILTIVFTILLIAGFVVLKAVF